MNISEQEKNRIRGLHKNNSIIKEQDKEVGLDVCDDYINHLKTWVGRDLKQLQDMRYIQHHDASRDLVNSIITKLGNDSYSPRSNTKEFLDKIKKKYDPNYKPE